ncbi:MAG: phage portal protein, partial [Bacteroidales bacterium]|nr:phage portal protein [Bacteroidales bacterium]
MYMGIFSGLFRSRDKPKDSYDSPSYSYFFGRTHAGKRVNDRTAMQIIAVYACVRVLSEAIAQLPLHVYQYTDNGKERVPRHPLYFLLHDQPNPEMTSFVFRETLMAHLLIYGNAYAQIIRNGRGEVLGLYPLMPDKVRVDRDDHGRLIYRYSRYDEHNPNFRQQGEIILPMEQVLHIPGLGYDGLVGYSPIAMAKNALGLAVACDEYGSSFFANGAAPSAVLEHPGVIKNPERVREAWQRAYGSSNAHKTAILEEGMKYTPISIPNIEAQFLETRKFQIEEIARLYRVPLHMIGDLDHATFSNIEHLSLEFVKYTLDPWLVRWEQGLQKARLSDSEQGRHFIKSNVEGLLRGDYASRMQGYATARQNGWMSANDIRELEDMNAISDEEGGNLYLVNGSFTKLEDAGAFAEKGVNADIMAQAHIKRGKAELREIMMQTNTIVYLLILLILFILSMEFLPSFL